VFCKLCTQSAHLNPDSRVGLWVEIGRTTEDLRRNFVLLQMVFGGIQRVLREELQELAKSFASGEIWTSYQSVDLCEANLRIDGICAFTSLLMNI
jgi:hypothetical protein